MVRTCVRPIRQLAHECFPATLIADASIYRYSLLPPVSATGLANNDAFPVNVLETCTLDGHGGGACVAQAWADGGPTATTTFTGPVAPFYTFTVGADGGGTNKNASGNARVGAGMGWVVLTVISGLWACFL
jgi:hypothetical protein